MFDDLISNRFTHAKKGFMMHTGFTIKETDHKQCSSKFQCNNMVHLMAINWWA